MPRTFYSATVASSLSANDRLDEVPVHTRIAGEFRVKTGRHEMALSGGYYGRIMRRENLHVRSHSLDSRRANEHSQIRLTQMGKFEIDLKGVHLTTERVAADIDVHQLESVLAGYAVDHAVRYEYCARACAPYRHARIGALGDWSVEPVRVHELGYRRGLATGYDQAVEVVELGGQPNSGRPHPQYLEGENVLAERPLKGQNANPHATSPAEP